MVNSCEQCTENFGLHKMRGTPLLAKQLLAAQWAHCSMGLASCVRLFRTVHTTNGDRSLYMLGFTVVGQKVGVIIGAHHHFHVSMIRVKLLRHVSVLIHHLQGVYSCVS